MAVMVLKTDGGGTFIAVRGQLATTGAVVVEGNAWREDEGSGRPCSGKGTAAELPESGVCCSSWPRTKCWHGHGEKTIHVEFETANRFLASQRQLLRALRSTFHHCCSHYHCYLSQHLRRCSFSRGCHSHPVSRRKRSTRL